MTPKEEKREELLESFVEAWKGIALDYESLLKRSIKGFADLKKQYDEMKREDPSPSEPKVREEECEHTDTIHEEYGCGCRGNCSNPRCSSTASSGRLPTIQEAKEIHKKAMQMQKDDPTPSPNTEPKTMQKAKKIYKERRCEIPGCIYLGVPRGKWGQRKPYCKFHKKPANRGKFHPSLQEKKPKESEETKQQ